MNQDRFAGMWKQFGGRLKERWGKLTHDPLLVMAGTRDQLMGRIQERRGLSKEATASQLKDFFYRNRHWDLLDR